MDRILVVVVARLEVASRSGEEWQENLWLSLRT